MINRKINYWGFKRDRKLTIMLPIIKNKENIVCSFSIKILRNNKIKDLNHLLYSKQNEKIVNKNKISWINEENTKNWFQIKINKKDKSKN